MFAQSTPPFDLMPMPAHVQAASGSLKIDEHFTIVFNGYTESRLDRAAQRFLTQLHHQTGLVLYNQRPSARQAPVLTVTTDRASKEVQELGEDESYRLEVTSSSAQLHAVTPLGAMHGLQTFLQLVQLTPDGFAAQAVTIDDQPRFPWRGLMIDCGRHFIPLSILKRNLDGLEAVKMNVFHWHLSEDQGFRIESRKYPNLQELGSDGHFYTQDEVRELIAYARDRGIRVVPEFDMPGHSTAWFVAHPEIASGTGPYSIERSWGVFDPAMDPTSDKTYKFLDGFLGEMTKLFPDQYFHVGGDEVNGKEWDRNPKIQEYRKAHHIQSNEELQAYFSKRVQELVLHHGKTPVGWDEILVPGVPTTIVIQSWRGAESLAAAAKSGYRGILSNGYYLDLGWSAARHYAVDPLGGAAASLPPAEQKSILGGESAMWSEYVNEENVDSRIWPRNAAIAERLWSPSQVQDVASMYERLDRESTRLEWLGLTHRSYQDQLLRRMSGPVTKDQFAALRIVAQALEPVKDYAREETAATPATSQTPLNRLVDAVQLESDSSREFSATVDRFLAGSCRDTALDEQIRTQLRQWADSATALEQIPAPSPLIREALPAIQALQQAATIGMSALNALLPTVATPVGVLKDQSDQLHQAELLAQKSQITLPMLPAITNLQQSGAPASCAPVPKVGN